MRVSLKWMDSTLHLYYIYYLLEDPGLKHEGVLEVDGLHFTLVFAVVRGGRHEQLDVAGAVGHGGEGRLHLRLHHLLLGGAHRLGGRRVRLRATANKGGK